MALWDVFLVLTSFINFAHTSPVVAYPYNAQVPPVARVSKPFFYTFASSTFSSTLPMKYTLSNEPSWLLLDGPAYTLHGTPATSDVGPDTITKITFGLTATDASGSTTLNATILISKNPGPTLSIPLEQQMLASTFFSSPSTLLYHPSTPFRFKLDPKTFENGGSSSSLVYYAVTDSNTPLPSWILFDEASLSFYGQTPDYQSLIQPPQTFGIQLIASDVQGFAGTSLFFDVEVGVHLLAFKSDRILINATASEEIRFDILSNIQLDGNKATRASISTIQAKLPFWLTIDNTTLILSGIVPNNTSRVKFTVEVTDIYGDTASSSISILTPTKLFKTPLKALNATAGTSFSHDLSTLLYNKSDVTVTAQFRPAADWISFDSKTFLMTGKPPLLSKESLIVCSLVAFSQFSQTSESQSFDFKIYPRSRTLSSTTSIFDSETTTTASVAPTVETSSTQPLRRLNTKLILAILLPVLTFLALILLAILCCLRRRHKAKEESYAGQALKHQISLPLSMQSDIIDIVGLRSTISSIQPPEPLQLDMTGFSEPRHTAISSNDPTEPTRSLLTPALRRSQTMSAVSDAHLSRLRESDLSGSRERAFSENNLSKTSVSFGGSGESAWVSVTSGTGSVGTKTLSRHFSNYSRKGYARRSGTIAESSSAAIQHNERKPTRSEAGNTILHLTDSSFSSMPLDKFSVLPMATSTKKTSTHMRSSGRPEIELSARRHSRFKAVLVGRVQSHTGLGHGGRPSITSMSIYLANPERKRRSIGHGQDWSSIHTQQRQLSLDSNNWVASPVSRMNPPVRRSIGTSSSAYSDAKDVEIEAMRTIRKVTKSPDADLLMFRSGSSTNSRHSRPVSRVTQSSPFFAGSSVRRSRRSPNKTRTSYADSPTVPEGATVFGRPGRRSRVLQELREESGSPTSAGVGAPSSSRRESMGVTYGLAQEGTRQLRSFIKSKISRARTGLSLQEVDINSRFAPATEMDIERGWPRSRRMTIQRAMQREESSREMGFDDYVVETEQSESSWETQLESSEHDDEHGDDGDDTRNEVSEMGDQENVVRYYDEADENDILQDELQLRRTGFLSLNREMSSASLSMPSSSQGEINTRVHGHGHRHGDAEGGESPLARMVTGRGRRPISVDARAPASGGSGDRGRNRDRVETSMRGEMDFSAYI